MSLTEGTPPQEGTPEALFNVEALVPGMDDVRNEALVLIGTPEDRRGEFDVYARSKLVPWQKRVIDRVLRESRIDLMKQAWNEFIQAVRAKRVPCTLPKFVSFIGFLVRRHAWPEERQWPPPRIAGTWKRVHDRERRYGTGQ